MRPIEHFEVPHLALFKSAVSRVLARKLGQSRTTAAAIDTDHLLMRATDRYCHAMEANEDVPEPSHDRSEDLELETYLAAQHHKKAHAKINGDKELEAQIEEQTARFKYGNPLWQDMYVQYHDYYWDYPFHKGEKPHYRSWKDPAFGNENLDWGVVDWRLPKDARVAIVGDIGTGTDVAAATLLGALRFNPHAILHVGDVYYSGTSFEVRQRLVGLVRAVMRSAKKRVPFFTVPGNHEYFTGCVALLDALDSNKLIVSPDQRQRASYFCLRSEDDGWQFLGLDTAYYGHYMNVAGSAQQATLDKLHLGKVDAPSDNSDPHWAKDHNPYFRLARGANIPQKDTTKPVDQVTVRKDEARWHRHKLEKFKGRSILLSHHQLYSALDVCGIAQKTIKDASGKDAPDPSDFNRAWIDTGLWREFGPAFGDKVAAWLWGHEHNLGIFESNYRPKDWPTEGKEAKSVFKTLPKGRCMGHAAIPVAEGEKPYDQKFPVNLEKADAKLGITDGYYNHGFAILELAGKGRPARLGHYQIREADPTPILVFEEQVT